MEPDALPTTASASEAAASFRLVIAGGGTGGHLYPGIAVAEECRRHWGAEVSFITTDRGPTLEILASYGLPWRTITSRALQGRRLWQRAGTLVNLPRSVWQAKKVLHQEAPDMVLGMGGYASGPVGLAASWLGIPLAIHEQNAILGFTNRWLARLATRIFLSFPDTIGPVAPERAVLTGNPIRPEFVTATPAPRPLRPFTVLVMGGSQGAHHLNMAMLAALEHLHASRGDLHCIHLTGSADEELVAQGYRERDFAATVAAFSPEVARFMQQAHLVICRAGASTLAELTALGRAALLVPYPYAAHQHQEKNARCLADAGAAFMVLNHELTGEKIAGLVQELLPDRPRLTSMEEASRALGRPGAAAAIARECQHLVRPAAGHDQ